MARPRLHSSRTRRVASRLTLAVVALQAVLLMTLWLDPTDPPRAGTLAQLWWASARRPSFYVLLAVAVLAPALTVLAWPVRGRHRRALVLAWSVFLVIACGVYAHRLAVMLRILYAHV